MSNFKFCSELYGDIMYKFEEHKIIILNAWGMKLDKKFSNVEFGSLYAELHGWKRNKFKIAEHMSSLFNMSQFYGDWKNKVEYYDTFIICDGMRGRDVVEFIKSKNPSARVIFFYLNLLRKGERNDPQKYSGLGVEFYTFDPVNAKEFGITYKYYCYGDFDYAKALSEGCNAVEHDVFFVGKDRGRLGRIIKMKKQLERYGKDMYTHILPSKHRKYSDEERQYLKTEYLDSRNALAIGAKSSAIMELGIAGQRGITLRAMVAMIMRKKIITDSQDIRMMDFYNEDNVLVLDDNTDGNAVSIFLDRPYKEYPQGMIDRFKPDIWIESFFTI